MFWFQFGSWLPWVHRGFVVLPVLPELANLLKAIELIKGLKEKVEADGVKQEEAYKKYKDTQSGGHSQKFLKVYMYAYVQYVYIVCICIYKCVCEVKNMNRLVGKTRQATDRQLPGLVRNADCWTAQGGGDTEEKCWQSSCSNSAQQLPYQKMNKFQGFVISLPTWILTSVFRMIFPMCGPQKKDSAFFHRFSWMAQRPTRSLRTSTRQKQLLQLLLQPWRDSPRRCIIFSTVVSSSKILWESKVTTKGWKLEKPMDVINGSRRLGLECPEPLAWWPRQ